MADNALKINMPQVSPLRDALTHYYTAPISITTVNPRASAPLNKPPVG